MTVFLIIVGAILLLLFWIVLSPIELFVDTRMPVINLRIKSIAQASIQFRQDEFWLNLHVFFMRFHWRMQDLKRTRKEPKRKPAKKKAIGSSKAPTKILRVLKSFRVRQFELRLSPSDYTVTGRLYPLNFIPLPKPLKLSVSFSENAYLMTTITTAPWRIVYALMKK